MKEEEKFVIKIKQAVSISRDVSDVCLFSIEQQPEELRGMLDDFSCESTGISVASRAHPQIAFDNIYGEGTIFIRGSDYTRDSFASSFDKKFLTRVIETLREFCDQRKIPYKFIIEINIQLGEIE